MSLAGAHLFGKVRFFCLCNFVLWVLFCIIIKVKHEEARAVVRNLSMLISASIERTECETR